ncbi:HNH endonuclease [Chelatococcus sp. GCM10030263]|uniref:HNH endonuclease n=1 Tax=Chelatococcus sp. GCM10030263 TaxID=3273387 RepID=UPI00360C76BE
MPKIQTLKPLVGRLRPQISTPREIRDTRYSPDAQVRGWYKSAAWQKLRRDVFARDGYICQRTGQICSGKHPAPNSPVANHKTPHRGDPALFWDINNIETVTKAVHDGVIQAEEHAADSATELGWPQGG